MLIWIMFYICISYIYIYYIWLLDHVYIVILYYNWRPWRPYSVKRIFRYALKILALFGDWLLYLFLSQLQTVQIGISYIHIQNFLLWENLSPSILFRPICAIPSFSIALEYHSSLNHRLNHRVFFWFRTIFATDCFL